MSFNFFSFKDLLRSLILGVLFGWLLISMHDPTHKRFNFDLAATPGTNYPTA